MLPQPAPERLEVAVAMVFNTKGEVLWTCRPPGKPYAGYWEFPGGKVERGETVWQALVRELREELNITAKDGAPWCVLDHDYEHAKVRLHFYRVWRFTGDVQPLENQGIAWRQPQQALAELSPILPATVPLIPKLAQPRLMLITRYGTEPQFEKRMEQALGKYHSPVYVQFREPTLQGLELRRAYLHAKQCVQQHKHILLINSSSLLGLQSQGIVPQGPVHLTEYDLLQQAHLGLNCLGASVHSQQAMAMAATRGLRYAVLGAVQPTRSHPGQAPLGWNGFAQLCVHTPLPVFAIGGLSTEDVFKAQGYGAHGVAVRSQWR